MLFVDYGIEDFSNVPRARCYHRKHMPGFLANTYCPVLTSIRCGGEAVTFLSQHQSQLTSLNFTATNSGALLKFLELTFTRLTNLKLEYDNYEAMNDNLRGPDQENAINAFLLRHQGLELSLRLPRVLSLLGDGAHTLAGTLVSLELPKHTQINNEDWQRLSGCSRLTRLSTGNLRELRRNTTFLPQLLSLDAEDTFVDYLGRFKNLDTLVLQISEYPFRPGTPIELKRLRSLSLSSRSLVNPDCVLDLASCFLGSCPSITNLKVGTLHLLLSGIQCLESFIIHAERRGVQQIQLTVADREAPNLRRSLQTLLCGSLRIEVVYGYGLPVKAIQC